MDKAINDREKDDVLFSNKKMYKSSTLQNILDRYIKQDQYNDFKPLLDEIFQRRAYEFEYDIEEMERQIKTFTRTCKKIKIVKSLGDLTYANYVKNTKEIHISRKMIDDNKIGNNKLSKEMVGEELFSSLTHEVYHAITARTNTVGLHILGTEEFVGKNGSAFVSLNEAVTETAADKASKGRTPNDVYYGFKRTKYYKYLTFIPQTLSQALGVKESDILKNGMSTLHNLKSYIESRFYEENEEEAKELFDKFNVNLDMYYKLLYFDNRGFSVRDIESLLNNTSKEMFSVTADYLSLKIKEEQTPLSKETVGEYYARIHNLKAIAVTQLELVQGIYFNDRNLDDDDMTYGAIDSYFNYNIGELMEKSGLTLYELSDPKIKEAYNKYNEKREFEDFDNFRQYDNSKIADYTYDLVDSRIDTITLSMEQKYKILKRRFKDYITRKFNPLLLNDNNDNNNKENSEAGSMDIDYENVPEDHKGVLAESYNDRGFNGNAFEHRFNKKDKSIDIIDSDEER